MTSLGGSADTSETARTKLPMAGDFGTPTPPRPLAVKAFGVTDKGKVRTANEDQFLIADVRMTADFPVERWFWFDPPFHNGQSALLHKQPDDIWRIDLQLGRVLQAVRPHAGDDGDAGGKAAEGEI